MTLYRDATATGLAPGADPGTIERLPAVFRLYIRTITAVAIRHMDQNALLAEIRHILADVDIGRIANRSRRVLVYLLLTAIRHHTGLLMELEQAWQTAPPGNKHAIAEAIATHENGTTGNRSLALARRADCPPDVANYLHSRFPH